MLVIHHTTPHHTTPQVRMPPPPPPPQVAHVAYYEMKQARKFTDETILELELAIVAAQISFTNVSAFAGLIILKFHFSLHSPHDIREGGPPCNRTAIAYEAKLQWIKRSANRTNFRNPIKSVVERWSLDTAVDLSQLVNSNRHHMEVVFASDESVTSMSLLAQVEKSGEVSLLFALLSGADPDQLWGFSHVASVSLHSVNVMPGSFILHWSEQHAAQCLALVTGILQLRKEEEAVSHIWLDILRFPGVPAPNAKQLNVSGDVWAKCFADPHARVRVLERFDQLRFTGVRQCPVPGAHVFIVAQ